jgi:DNA-binding MarR family transcriptional regulator
VLAVASGLTQAEVRAAVAKLVAAGLAPPQERPDKDEPRQMVRITERGRGLFVHGIPWGDPVETRDDP